MHRSHRIRHATGVPGWGSTPGWGEPLPGWSPLVDHGSPSLRVAGSIARWWWPTLAVAGFLAVVAYVTGHDHPGPSNRGLFIIALAAVVVVLLTVHRTAGPGPLARATAEYSVVALLAALLALTGSADQPPTNPAAETDANQAATDKPNLDAGQDRRPGVLRVAAGVARAVTTAIRAITGAASWVADLWRQANAKADHPKRPPTTASLTGEAIQPSPAPPLATRRLL